MSAEAVRYVPKEVVVAYGASAEAVRYVPKEAVVAYVLEAAAEVR